MTEITDTDYETVEREVTRYECDHCEHAYDEREDVARIEIGTSQFNAFGDEEFETQHFCEDCVGLREAYRRTEISGRFRSFGEGFADGTGVGSALVAIAIYAFGVGSIAWLPGMETNGDLVLVSSGILAGSMLQFITILALALVTLVALMIREVWV